MDTREKIVPIESILKRTDKPRVVVGYFDPLYSANVARLQEIGRAIVIVADKPDAILPLRARAELVASLNTVENVAICAGNLTSLDGLEFIDERQADDRRTTELAQHIITRYRTE